MYVCIYPLFPPPPFLFDTGLDPTWYIIQQYEVLVIPLSIFVLDSAWKLLFSVSRKDCRNCDALGLDPEQPRNDPELRDFPAR